MKSSVSEIVSQYILPAVKGAVAAVLVFSLLIFFPLKEETPSESQEHHTDTVKYSIAERTPEQIREAQRESEPYYYDEYGVRYQLSDDLECYYIDEDYVAELETPESTAFTNIAYRPFHKELCVTFRNSGVTYVYYNVEPEVWNEFKNADSLGGFFHEAIKGYYEYDRE